jgi:hypothetical protein
MTSHYSLYVPSHWGSMYILELPFDVQLASLASLSLMNDMIVMNALRHYYLIHQHGQI